MEPIPVIISTEGKVLQAPSGWLFSDDLQQAVLGFQHSGHLQKQLGKWQFFRLHDLSTLVLPDLVYFQRWTAFLQDLPQQTSEPEILKRTTLFLQDIGFEVLHQQTCEKSNLTLSPEVFCVPLDAHRVHCWTLKGEFWELLPELSSTVQQAVKQHHSFQRYLNALQYFQELQVAITDQLEWQDTLKLVLYYTREALQADAAVFFMWDEQDQMLELIDTIGHRTPTEYGFRIARDYGLAGEVLEPMKTHVVSVMDPADFDDQSRGFLLREGFVGYAGTPLRVKGRLLGILEIFHRSPLEPSAWWLSFFELLASHLAIALYQHRLIRDLTVSNQQLIHTYDATLEGWVRALDLRDKETEGHSKRVMEGSLKLARKMGLSGHQLEHIRRGALLHDIGKLAIPDQILHKPGKLTTQEFDVVKQHPVWARAMLRDIEYLRNDLDIPYHHHEKWDGSGYPLGLKADEIPLSARIFSVVDVWDAMTSDRPYRKGLPEEDVLAYIQEQSGKHFDPQVVRFFIELVQES